MSSRGSRSKKSGSENQSHGDYMSEKIRKLDEQFQGDAPTNKEKSGTSSDIFRGVIIHVNGYTDPSSDELKRLMTIHGGMYKHYYSVSKVTHIIATNLPYAKLRQLRNEKIVKPEWITDSIKAGHLLPSLPYELYTDRSSRQNQAVLQLSKGPQAKANASSTRNGVSSPVPEAAAEERQSDVSRDQEEDEGASLSKQDENVDARDTSAQGGSNRSFGMATAGDANFLSEFYSNSRLHHIATWGAECKAYVNELQSKGDSTFPGKQRLFEVIKEKGQGQVKKGDLGGVDSMDCEQEWGEDAIEDSKGNENRTTRSSKATAGKDKTRKIMHIDMDCFFVSVGLIKRPDLVDIPVAVTHSKGQVGMSESRQEIRQFESDYYAKKYGSDAAHQNHKENKSNISEDSGKTGDVASSESSSKPKETFHSMADIASCNYEARECGVKNGMSMGRAKSLCPELQTIPYDFDGYKRVSQKLYDIIASYTHDIEAVSCDEMFVDISGILRETGATAEEFARILREEIKDKTQCSASAGIASNILLARMATRVAKPNGQFILEPQAVDDFIRTQPVKDLPGVGRSTTRKMESLDIKTCGDLQQLSLSAIQKEFGNKTGQMLYGFCRGLDDRPIKQEQERKSVSAEVNYGIRFKQESDSEKFITELAAEVHKRLTGVKMLARTITIKLKVRHPDAPKETSKFMGHGICEDKARSFTLGQATDDVQVIQRESKKLLKETQVPAVDMRGVGIQLSKLISSTQAGILPSKSITSFMTKAKPADNTSDLGDTSLRSADQPMTSTSSTAAPALSGSKPKAKTMLNFVSKRPAEGEAPSAGDGKDFSSKTPRKKRNSVLPPLPFMPGQKGPSQSSNLALPSPSQIDMAVLQELPKDLQEQILESYKGQKPIHSTSGNTSEPSTSSGITDSSRWDQGIVGSVPPHILEELIQDDRSDETSSSLGVVEALPSFSQVLLLSVAALTLYPQLTEGLPLQGGPLPQETELDQCEFQRYEIQEEQCGSKIVQLPLCNPGQRRAWHCPETLPDDFTLANLDIYTLCQSCPPSTFQKWHNKCAACHPCTVCGEGETEEKACEREEDTKCVKALTGTGSLPVIATPLTEGTLNPTETAPPLNLPSTPLLTDGVPLETTTGSQTASPEGESNGNPHSTTVRFRIVKALARFYYFGIVFLLTGLCGMWFIKGRKPPAEGAPCVGGDGSTGGAGTATTPSGDDEADSKEGNKPRETLVDVSLPPDDPAKLEGTPNAKTTLVGGDFLTDDANSGGAAASHEVDDDSIPNESTVGSKNSHMVDLDSVHACGHPCNPGADSREPNSAAPEQVKPQIQEDDVVTTPFLQHVAHEVPRIKIKIICRMLGLQEKDIEEIQFLKHTDEQGFEFLKRLLGQVGKDLTYRSLLQALNRSKNKHYADRLIEEFNIG